MKKRTSVKILLNQPVRNEDGFTVVLLMIVLPSLISFLMLIINLVFLFELKSEFRYKCLVESKKILQYYSGDSLSLKASELLKNLKNINSLTPFKSEIMVYPSLESNNEKTLSSSLVYLLKYKWISSFEMHCGARKTKKDSEWVYENIYTTSEAKF